MKCDVTNSLVQIENGELKKLCAQVKETIANDFCFPEKKPVSFGIADLWKLRKTMKIAGRVSNTRRGIQPVV